MRQRAKISVLLLVAYLAIATVLAIRIRRGFSARDEPTALEAAVATRMRRWSVPAALRDARNPVALTPPVLVEARAHWADHCATCHGNDGKGQTTIGERLYPRAPDMTLPRTQRLSDGELFAIIENGVRLTGMPGWGDGTAESRRESWALVHLIRRLPRITPEDLAEMEKLNPKTPEELEEQNEEDAFLKGEDAVEAASPTPATVSHHH
ncbi:MAG TPA: c-type cytochrome [Thermoanaerobaculia bacterium]|jgi:mono/diheme cytochrome c family protein|nr:c-type cytochrome [Thermoanaerobaculia bacterium]